MLATNAGLLTPVLGDPSPWTPQRLYTNGETGLYYEPADLTAEKVAWRRNLCVWTDTHNASTLGQAGGTTPPTITATTYGGRSVEAVTLPAGVTGFSVSRRDGAIVGKSGFWSMTQVGVSHTASVTVALSRALTGSEEIRIFQTGVQGSWNIFLTAATPNATTLTRYSATAVATTTGNQGTYVLSSGAALSADVTVYLTDFQVNVGTTASAYQRITDFTSDFLAAFPTHALYQDSAGTTPVTVLGQPVGLALDKSRGGLANIGATVLANGDFASGTGWTAGTGWSIAAGVATKTAGTASVLSQAVTLTIPGTYRLVYTMTRSAGTLTPRITGGTTVSATARSASGTYTEYVTTVTGNTTFEFSADASFAGTVDDVALQLVPGVHAIQATSASRPALDARVNLLLNTGWAGAVAGSPGTAPTSWFLAFSTGSITSVTGDGVGNNALALSASASRIVLAYTFSVAANATYCCDVLVGANSGLQLSQILGFTSAPAGSTISYEIDGAAATASSVPSAGSRARIILANGATAGTPDLRVGAGASSNSTGTVTVSRPSITLLADAAYPYQRVTTATDYADVGVPRSFLFYGFDDSLYTASTLNLSGTDKVTVWAGVYKNSDAATGAVVHHRITPSTYSDGSFFINGPEPGGTASFGVGCRGTTALAWYQALGLPAPRSVVISGSFNTGAATKAEQVIPRYNGTVVQTGGSAGATSAGNFANAVTHFGSAGGLPFNGKLYIPVVRGAQTDAATLALTERYVGSRMGIVL
jgi:hypothetical protein